MKRLATLLAVAGLLAPWAVHAQPAPSLPLSGNEVVQCIQPPPGTPGAATKACTTLEIAQTFPAFTSQTPNLVFAGPCTGPSATPAFRLLCGADLPLPSPTTLGGVQSRSIVTHQWVNGISTLGVVTLTQPAFTDLLGNATVAQGGTGLTTLTAHGVMIGEGTSNVTLIAPGTSGYCLTSNGASADPSYQACPSIMNQNANLVYAGPSSGGAAAPTFRALVNNDLAFDATTVNGQSCVLGSTCTVTVAATTVTVGTTTVASSTNGHFLFNNAGTLGDDATTGSGSVVLATSPTLVTPALGTPSAAVLTNATGLPVSTGISGLGSGVAAALAAGVTGSGNVVLATSPTLVTPSLGTPSALNLANATNLSLTAGVTGTLPVANGGTGVTSSTGSGSNVLSNSPTLVTPALGTPSAAVLTNATGLPLSTGITGFGSGVEAGLAAGSTGSGNVVLSTSPTLVTPALGTPSALILTNATGLPNASVIGLGTAALINTGTSGGTLGLLNGALTFSGADIFSAGLQLGSPTGGNEGAGTINTASGYYLNGINNNSQVPQDVRLYGAKCDGSTNDATAINSALASGVLVGIPQNSTCVISSTLNISVSNSGIVSLQGSSLLSNAAVTGTGSWFKWNGSSGGTMLSVSSTLGASNGRIGGIRVEGVNFDGNSGLAANAITIKSILNSEFANLFMQHFNSGDVIDVDVLHATTSGGTQFGDNCDTQMVGFDNIYVSNYSYSSNALHLNGWLSPGIDAGIGGCNASLDTFRNMDLEYGTGIGILSNGMDNMHFWNVRTYQNGGSPGVSVDLNFAHFGSSWYPSNSNTFDGFSAATSNATVSLIAPVLRGTATESGCTVYIGTFGTTTCTFGNTFFGYDKGNGTPDPVLETNAQAVVYNNDASGLGTRIQPPTSFGSGYFAQFTCQQAILASSYASCFEDGGDTGVVWTDATNQWSLGLDGVNFRFDHVAGTGSTVEVPSLSYTGSQLAKGSPPTLSGTCTTSTQVGGNTAGSFHATCVAQTVILAFGTTSPTGWTCVAKDLTTPTDSLNETASTIGGCTLQGTTAAGDVIAFTATGW